ncbi:MAG: phosphoribosyl transferase [Dehalococcoidales bacterium]|nr:phosphoribosyl transferase [Dehalococcoidales bacterium]
MKPDIIFDNRHDAGRKLAEVLSQYQGKPVVVLAIPNGGVPIGLEVAKAINAEFDVVITRKIPMPLSPEGGFGAIADDGTMILNENIVKKINLTMPQIDYEANKVRSVIKKRTLLYRGNRPLTRVLGKSVIVIDDGLASGITMKAAVTSIRHRRPKEIIVAVPTASTTALPLVRPVADRVITCITGAPPYAVSDYYRHWYDVPDDEVVKVLENWRAQHIMRV